MQKTGLIIGRGIYLDNDISSLTYYRGRVALFALLKALNIGQGDQVAIQAFTCVAVPEAILAAGAEPIYIDIAPEGVNMDPADLDQKITSKTRAIIVQHTFGIPIEMDRIEDIAKQRNIPIIEDCCHTILSKYKSKKVGTFGVASFYSFEWGKPIVIGIGGALRVNDPSLHEAVKHQYNQLKQPPIISSARLCFQYLAHKILYRPNLYWPLRSMYRTLGAIGVAESNYNPIEPNRISNDFSWKMSLTVKKRLIRKLKFIEKITQHSRWVTSEYSKFIKSTVVEHPKLNDEYNVVFCRYPLLTKNKSKLLTNAKKSNIELAEWYATPVHPLKGVDLALVNYKQGSCPTAEKRCQQVVTLPTHFGVSKRIVESNIQFLNDFIE